MASRIATSVASKAASRILVSTTGTRFRNHIQSSISQTWGAGAQLPQLLLRNHLVSSRILGPAFRLRLRQPQRFTSISFSKRLFVQSMRWINHVGRRAVFNYGVISTIGYGSRKFWERFLARAAKYDSAPYSPLWFIRQFPIVWLFLGMNLVVLWMLGGSHEEESVAVMEKKREQSRKETRTRKDKGRVKLGDVKIRI